MESKDNCFVCDRKYVIKTWLYLWEIDDYDLICLECFLSYFSQFENWDLDDINKYLEWYFRDERGNLK